MHEFVLSGRGAKEQLGVKTLDIAKRLLDHGVHPPTVYFPLLVDEALMIEPTETETKERLDHFADVVRAILEEAAEDPEIARNAPYTTPVRRLDEAGARRSGPVVRWRPDEGLASRAWTPRPTAPVADEEHHPGGAAPRRPQPRAAARGAALSDHARPACTTC